MNLGLMEIIISFTFIFLFGAGVGALVMGGMNQKKRLIQSLLSVFMEGLKEI